jgi:hypothetical protein
MRGNHLKVVCQRILRPAFPMNLSEMFTAGATLPSPEPLGDSAEPDRIHVGNPNNAARSSLQIENVVILIGFANSGSLMAGEDLDHQTVVVFVSTPELRALTTIHLLSNLKN